MSDSIRICFSVLHYQDFEVTRRCVDSLLALPCPDCAIADIVIVDNASPNGSYAQLINVYSNNPKVHLIYSEVNGGFAKGNNIAFDYIKEQQYDAGVFLNNDTEILQQNFVEELLTQLPFDVLAVDVYDPNFKAHQSPLCLGAEVQKYAADEMSIKQAYLDAPLGKRIGLDVKAHVANAMAHIGPLRGVVKQRMQGNVGTTAWRNPLDDVVPQGSAVIFGKSYLEKMPYAFYPETRMYFEEAILKVLADKEGLTVRYAPQLQVLHHHYELMGYIKKNYYASLKRTAELERESYAVLCELAGWKYED